MTPAEAHHWLHLSTNDTLGRLITGPVARDLIDANILRFYQYDILVEVARLMRLGVRRILIVLPTGGGKTRMAAAMIGSALAQQERSQFIVHRKELINQTSKAFTGLDIPHGFIASGREYDYSAEVTLAGIQTLVRRLDKIEFPPRLAIVDEGHHATAGTWDEVLDAYEQKDCFIVGLTATPERLDGKGLEDKFDAMVVGPSAADLIEWGFLSQFDYYAPGQPDLSGVHTTAGDFNRGEIAELMDKPKLIGDIIEHYYKYAAGQQGIIFAASIEHSRNIVDEFRLNGIAAAHVDGNSTDRDNIVESYQDGQIQIMSNVDLFGEGFDVPATVYCGLARPTKSLGLHLQQVGRALRPSPGKDRAIICDHAGNALRPGLGLPDDDREWSLKGRAGRAKGGGAPDDSIPVHQCMECYRVVPSSVRICPGCQTEFPIQVRKIAQEDGLLTKLERQFEKETLKQARELEKLEKEKTKEARRIKRKIEERECKTYEDFKQLAFERGYPNPAGWAKVQSKLRHGGRIS